MSLPIIYQGKDFQFNIGPIYLDTDTLKENPINIANLAQFKVSVFTDIRFKAVSALVPGTDEGQLERVTDYVYTMFIDDESTALMKEGCAYVTIESDQTDANYTDGENNQAGQAIRFEVRELK